MGQRLNIEIVKGDRVLANSYYHWSAFSGSAIALTEEIVKCYNWVVKEIKDYKCNDKDLLLAIKLLEATGAGFNEKELEAAKEMLGVELLDLAICKSRNEGIISVTEKGKEETELWEEGRVTIDIGDRTFDFGVVFEEDYEYLINDCEIDKDEIGEANIRFDNVPFSDVFEMKGFIDKANYKGQLYFHNNYDGSYFSLYE